MKSPQNPTPLKKGNSLKRGNLKNPLRLAEKGTRADKIS